MKLHLTKKEVAEKSGFTQLIGLSKPTQSWLVQAFYELNDEERAILERYPEVKKIQVFEYTREGLDLSPTVEAFTSPKFAAKGGRSFTVYSVQDLQRIEEEITEGAKKLKHHLYSLVDASGSSSTVQDI
jgi:hypothetical protein